MLFRKLESRDFDTLYAIRKNIFYQNSGDIHSTLENLPSSDQFIKLLQDGSFDHVLVVEVDSEVLGFGTVLHWQESDDTVVFLHQSYVPNTVDDYELTQKKLLQKLQEIILDMAAGFNSPQKVFAANSSGTEIDSLKILEADGYKIVWSQVEMELSDLDSLPGLSLPAGFAIKKVTPDIYRKIYDLNKTVYQNTWGATNSSDSDYQEFLEDNPQPQFWTVAWQGSAIAGFVLSRIINSIGVVNEVSVLPEFRRQGLASFLLVENLKLLNERGINIVRLHTDSESRSGARQLYESLGFKSLKNYYRLRKPF